MIRSHEGAGVIPVSAERISGGGWRCPWSLDFFSPFSNIELTECDDVPIAVAESFDLVRPVATCHRGTKTWYTTRSKIRMTTATAQITAMTAPIIVLGIGSTAALSTKPIRSAVATSLVRPR